MKKVLDKSELTGEDKVELLRYRAKDRMLPAFPKADGLNEQQWAEAQLEYLAKHGYAFHAKWFRTPLETVKYYLPDLMKIKLGRNQLTHTDRVELA